MQTHNVNADSILVFGRGDIATATESAYATGYADGIADLPHDPAYAFDRDYADGYRDGSGECAR